MATARVPAEAWPLLDGLVAAHHQLHRAWLEARPPGDSRAERLLGEAMGTTVNAVDETFPGVFLEPMSCFEEPLIIEELKQ